MKNIFNNTAIINGKTYTSIGLVDIIGGRLIMGGEVQDATLPSVVEIRVLEGSIGHLTTTASVTCGNVEGNVAANGDVTCGSVGGDVRSDGDVKCTSVGKDVKAGGDVECGDVGGNVKADGDVECGTVHGSVRRS